MYLYLKQHTTRYIGHIGKKKNQNEVMVETCSSSLVGAFGKVLCMNFRTPTKPIKVMKDGLSTTTNSCCGSLHQ